MEQKGNCVWDVEFSGLALLGVEEDVGPSADRTAVTDYQQSFSHQ